MKKILLLLLFCLAFTGVALAEEKTEQTLPSTTPSFLLPMPDASGKWGYINSQGKFEIAPQYDKCPLSYFPTISIFSCHIANDNCR